MSGKVFDLSSLRVHKVFDLGSLRVHNFREVLELLVDNLLVTDVDQWSEVSDGNCDER